MEKLSNKIANKVASELGLDVENKEIIAYGSFALIQMIFSVSLVFVFGIVFHVAIEALIISFTGAILRKYSGGVHASSPGTCTFIGTFICVGQAVLLALLIRFWLNLKVILIIGVVIFICSYYIIYKLAPVDSVLKPIVKEDKRRRMKKGSIILLSIYLIISIVFLLLYISKGERDFILYTLCLYSGLLWQVFTLTKPGHLFLGKVDSFLNHITEQRG